MEDATLGPERIELDELIAMAWEVAASGMHLSCPAVVVTYNQSAGTVEVSLPIDRLVPDGAGNLVAEPLPNLKDVPIAWMRCRGYAITFPLVAGDTGQLVICERSIAAWRAGTAGHPGDTGMHTLDGSVFHLGLMDDAHAPTHTSATDMIMGTQNATSGSGPGKSIIGIKPTGGGYLGEGATKGIARNGDSVKVTIPIGTFLTAATAGVLNAAPVEVTGTVTNGSVSWKVVD